MLEDIKTNIAKLIALFESERQRADSLAQQLAQSEEKALKYREQVTDLNQQIDNLKLLCAFNADGNPDLAKERINKLIREIDKCIKLLEK